MKTDTQTPHLVTVAGSSHRDDGMTITSVRVHDVYEYRRVGRKLVRAFTAFLEWYLQKNPAKRLEDPTNLARLLVYSAPGMRAWRDYMPGGIATHHAHRPQDRVLTNGKRIDIITRNFFRHTHESVGLRSRADILSWLVMQQYTATGQSPRWVSLACGTGQPVYDTLQRLGKVVAESTTVYMTDVDELVLRFAQELYRTQEVQAQTICFEQVDAVEAPQLEWFKALHPSVIDAMGLFEYLNDTQAISLLQMIHSVLPVGGQFIFCNMRRDHPQLAVHQRALGWPGVIQRSDDEYARLFSQAGISLSSVTVYQAQDGVYNVYRVVR